MNNSKLIEDVLNTLDEKEIDIQPALREQSIKLSEIVEALSAISQSEYWVTIQTYFNDDLLKLERRLETEEDTMKIFRLQGEIKSFKKMDLKKILADKRRELEIIKSKLHE